MYENCWHPCIRMDKSNFNIILGQHIKAVRESKKMTQPELAALMGINFQNISSYERGEVSPTLFWINRLCESLEINPEIFLNEFYKKLSCSI